MMLVSTFNLLFAVAMLTSYAAVSRRVDERLGGAVAFGLWGLTAAGALSHTTYETGEEIVVTSPGLAAFAAGASLMMVAFTAAAITNNLPELQATRYSS